MDNNLPFFCCPCNAFIVYVSVKRPYTKRGGRAKMFRCKLSQLIIITTAKANCNTQCENFGKISHKTGGAGAAPISDKPFAAQRAFRRGLKYSRCGGSAVKNKGVRSKNAGRKHLAKR